MLNSSFSNLRAEAISQATDALWTLPDVRQKYPEISDLAEELAKLVINTLEDTLEAHRSHLVNWRNYLEISSVSRIVFETERIGTLRTNVIRFVLKKSKGIESFDDEPQSSLALISWEENAGDIN